MSADEVEQAGRRWRLTRSLTLISSFFLTIILALASLLVFRDNEIGELNLTVGNVAPQDIEAPFAITYESEVLTARQRAAAASSVPLVYSPADMQLARTQADALRTALAFITNVRADQFASTEEKYADLTLVADGRLSPDGASGILALTPDEWQSVQQEAILVLGQIQRSTIRPEQLEDAVRSIPVIVSLSLPDTQAIIVAELAGLFVVPTSFYSEELTAVRRAEAASAVPGVDRTFVTGETIVPRGHVLVEEDIEALSQLGLLQPINAELSLIKAAIWVALAMTMAVLYLYTDRDLLKGSRQIVFLSVTFLLFLVIGRMVSIGHVVIPFIFPVAAFGLLLASLFGTLPALILPLSLSLLISFGMPNALEMMAYYNLTSIFGVIMLGRSQRIISFFWAGIGAASLGAALIAGNRLLDPHTDLTGLTTLAGAAYVYGLASSGLTVLLQFLGAKWLRLTTNLQLVELTRPQHPLLRHLLMSAPGTYQHSLQVANLAELAAERIGADPLLTRVGALYHDVGKANNPQYFIENQVPGTPNLHDVLDPLDSARIIIRHVADGVELAKKYRLPQPIIAFVQEHHGTMLTPYQYVRAVNANHGDKSLVDTRLYSYAGPRPHSRETALVMLADGCEARARSERPPTEFALRALIKDTVDNRIGGKQLDDVPLTPRDLNTIIEIFTSTLKGVYHPRIEYPKIDHRTVPAPARRTPAKDPAIPNGEPSHPVELPAQHDD